MEKKTGISGKDYMVIRDMELRVEPIEMQPKIEYSLPRRIVEQVKKIYEKTRS
jgi:hypothetical protein